MSKSSLLAAGADLITEVKSLLPEEREALSRSLVVFPGQRPGLFLRRSLAESLGGPYRPPVILSMDEFVQFLDQKAGHEFRQIPDLDGVALLFELQRLKGLPGRASPLPFDEFLPWGFKLLSDLEDLKIGLAKPAGLEGLEDIAGEQVPHGLRGLLADLSKLFQAFYEQLSEKGLTTRASSYARVAEEIAAIDLSDYRPIILAGFFGLTRSEVIIFQSLQERGNVHLLFQEGPGIKEKLKELSLELKPLGTPEPFPEVAFFQAADRHGEVMGLAGVTSGRQDLDQTRVIVLPAPQALFPVIQQVLSRVPGNFNVSLGYPLLRTPVIALIEMLAAALEKAENGRYFLPDYLGLMLHPSIKNIPLSGNSSAARIIWHTMEEKLSEKGSRFIALEDIESWDVLLEECQRRLLGAMEGGVDRRVIRDFIARIHGILLRPFEAIKDIADFGSKLGALLSLVSEESPANRHPYSGEFLRAAIEALDELAHSALERERLPQPGDYFQFLRTCLSSVVKHFPGTPLEGLQVLGSLETRNLKFDEVFFLDANEGVLPVTGKLDSLLPYSVRKQLCLTTHLEREGIQRYYFYTLLRGCRKAHLFFVQSDDQHKSRLVEDLLWQEQQRRRTLELDNFHPLYFRADFRQSKPEPVRKSRAVMEFLQKQPFSPTSLDAYLRCPLLFYYRYVLRLNEKDLLGEGMEASEIGTVVHRILKEFFAPWESKALRIAEEDEKRLQDFTLKAFRERYGQDLGGPAYLIHSQVKAQMGVILRWHQREPVHGAFIRSCEQRLSCAFDFGLGREVFLEGKIDRIDERNGEIVILDYKTGSRVPLPSRREFGMDQREEWPRTLRSVQVPLYLLLYHEQNPETDPARLNGSLLMLHQRPIGEEFLFNADDDRPAMLGVYREAIATLVIEIMNPDREFTPTTYPKEYCPTCDFKVFCGRQWIPARRS